MNERLKCESRQGAMNVWVWVIVTVEQGGCFRPIADEVMMCDKGE